VPAWYDQRTQGRDRIRIVERDGQLVLRDDRAVRWEAEEAVGNPISHPLINSTVVSGSLVGVAFVAERSEVGEVVAAAVASWVDVIDLKFLC
jgi:hypothetical protein